MPPNKNKPTSSQEGIIEISDFPAGMKKSRYAATVVNIDRRFIGHSVFQVDDSAFVSAMPRSSHWSVAWSDLMMTMFVLFLSMFVYQTAHQDFLQKQEGEIIGGDTTTALKNLDISGASFPFAPIHPGLPLVTGGTIKETIPLQQDIPPLDQQDSNLPKVAPAPDTTNKNIEKTDDKSRMVEEHPDKIGVFLPQEKVAQPPIISGKEIPVPPEDIAEPLPLVPEEPPAPPDTSFKEIYSLGKGAVTSNNLEKFASIDIIPDKTMRIILTSDLLFGLGESALSKGAKKSLRKIASVIRYTPYMINVVGHTDNIPMKSGRFPSNWELSVARASAVARFLIDDIKMSANQFVVSGFSSYRPLKPNTNAENRAKNRRVEIIISKQLPNPVKATAKNLQ